MASGRRGGLSFGHEAWGRISQMTWLAAVPIGRSARGLAAPSHKTPADALGASSLSFQRLPAREAGTRAEAGAPADVSDDDGLADAPYSSNDSRIGIWTSMRVPLPRGLSI